MSKIHPWYQELETLEHGQTHNTVSVKVLHCLIKIWKVKNSSQSHQNWKSDLNVLIHFTVRKKQYARKLENDLVFLRKTKSDTDRKFKDLEETYKKQVVMFLFFNVEWMHYFCVWL